MPKHEVVVGKPQRRSEHDVRIPVEIGGKHHQLELQASTTIATWELTLRPLRTNGSRGAASLVVGIASSDRLCAEVAIAVASAWLKGEEIASVERAMPVGPVTAYPIDSPDAWWTAIRVERLEDTTWELHVPLPERPDDHLVLLLSAVWRRARVPAWLDERLAVPVVAATGAAARTALAAMAAAPPAE